MQNLEIIHQIKKLSIEERIKIMELILHSFKSEMQHPSELIKPRKFKRFRVRQFSLGREIHVDRNELYAERG